MDGACLATVMGRCTVSMVTSDHPWFRCAASWRSTWILLMDALFFPSAVWNLAQMLLFFMYWQIAGLSQRFSVHISDVSSKQMQNASEGSSLLCHLAKNLIPSLAAGIYGLYWRDSPATVSGRTGTLTISSGIPFFSWSLVPDILSPSFCPWQWTLTTACDAVDGPLFPTMTVAFPYRATTSLRQDAYASLCVRACRTGSSVPERHGAHLVSTSISEPSIYYLFTSLS